MIGFADEAWESIQCRFDDPALATPAERFDAMLDAMEQDSDDQRVERYVHFAGEGPV